MAFGETAREPQSSIHVPNLMFSSLTQHYVLLPGNVFWANRARTAQVPAEKKKALSGSRESANLGIEHLSTLSSHTELLNSQGRRRNPHRLPAIASPLPHLPALCYLVSKVVIVPQRDPSVEGRARPSIIQFLASRPVDAVSLRPSRSLLMAVTNIDPIHHHI